MSGKKSSFRPELLAIFISIRLIRRSIGLCRLLLCFLKRRSRSSNLYACWQKHKRPFVASAARRPSSLAGGPVPIAAHAQVVIALARLNRIARFDAAKQEAIVEAGRGEFKASRSYQRIPDFSSRPIRAAKRRCTLGGNVATNIAGRTALFEVMA